MRVPIGVPGEGFGVGFRWVAGGGLPVENGGKRGVGRGGVGTGKAASQWARVVETTLWQTTMRADILHT